MPWLEWRSDHVAISFAEPPERILEVTNLLAREVDTLRVWVMREVEFAIQNEIGVVPGPVAALRRSLQELQQKLSGAAETISPPEAQLLKRALLHGQARLSFEREETLARTTDAATREQIEVVAGRLRPFMTGQWFAATTAARIPRLTEFLTLKAAYSAAKSAARKGNRPPTGLVTAFDEKFGILQAPGGFSENLSHYREECELRGRPISVAFVDLDSFKALNTKYQETTVDYEILPRVMSALEAHVYAHGQAFKQGGDEYLLLLPNCDRASAIDSLFKLQDSLRALKFGMGITETIATSIGLFTLDDDCTLTNREVLNAVNAAESFAKKAGKNCLVTYAEGSHDPRTLSVVTRTART